ncbi:MAG: BamA/TamA family outer membrane protein [Candidatus Zixiibacteriota bacterium]|jgi:hypothetical protein
MTRYNYRFILSLFALAAIMTSSALAEEPQYKEYKPQSTRSEAFEIAFDEETIEIAIFEDSTEVRSHYRLDDMRVARDTVFFKNRPAFNPHGVTVAGEEYPWEEVYDTRITQRDDMMVITFFSPPDQSRRLLTVKRGNIIDYAQDIHIDRGEFVRGIVFTVLGDITVDGEVNRDIISLFGNVDIGPEAVARGDAASITGEVEIAKHASIYGETYTAEGVKAGRRGRFYRAIKENEFAPGIIYNRVDGAHPWFGYKFDDGDSLLPRVDVRAGYAFASERFRFNVGIEQTVWRRVPLSVGASIYRRLASTEDWVIGSTENTVFALIAKEDFLEYYEADGGTLYMEGRPIRDLLLRLGYRYEETNWLSSHRHLWSLFGGDKLFSENFRRVDPAYREFGIHEIDTTANAGITLSAEYKTVDEDEPFSTSSWDIGGSLEWSHPDLNSDFDYRRYRLSATRYQKLNRYTTIIGRAMYGGSDGYLPMYKRFFLGGLGTLRGYYQYEFMGTQFWMANLEYRFQIPSGLAALSLIYDAARIANDTKLSETDIKQSLGVAFYLGSDFRISVAKRLDRSYDDTPKIYVRLSNAF